MSRHSARVRPLVLALAALVVLLCLSGVRPPAAATDDALRLTAGSSQVGWISLAVRGPAGTPVEVREQIGKRRSLVARVVPGAGMSVRPRAARWRCAPRLRRFVATAAGPAGAATSSASVLTPSCAHRLSMIVVPARLRPGRAARVRVADSWRFGGLSARVCATRGAFARCRKLRLAPGRVRLRARVPLTRAGRWQITLRSRSSPPLRRVVAVRPDARVKLLVTGDSMIYRLSDVLGRRLAERAQVQGDPRPGTGISKPTLLDWPAHARSSARTARPDVTVVFLGVADYRALTPPIGPSAQCCTRAWSEEYARRVSLMASSYLRDGRGLVYWTLLPAPRTAERVPPVRAVNRAIRLAAAGFADGVRLIDLAAVITPGGRFQKSIVRRGRLRRVRAADGVHLSSFGTEIAASLITRALRGDGMAR